MQTAQFFMTILGGVVVSYFVVQFTFNLSLVFIASRAIRRELSLEHLRPALHAKGDRLLPSVTLLVPAYNEEVTIVESLRSLIKLKYPSFEIVICNDGSRDRTMDVLLRAFDFERLHIEHEGTLGCAEVRAFYEVRAQLTPGLKRMVLIDKKNGGKADALNACINFAQGDFVTSMDADSLLVPETLLMAARTIVRSAEPVVAVGAQVGLSNGSLVHEGRVVEMRLPRSWIARFQIVEYMRSFSQGRVGLAALDSLVVLSGVFALMRRDIVLTIGGFLTPHMRARVSLEYCGAGAHTVCEDMEIIVRIHRYMRDHLIRGRVAILPFPMAWTEAPESYRDLGKQRARWYRGLLEVLYYHRGMMFRRRFGPIGLFALPYQLVFEALSPLLECFGVLTLAASALLGSVSLRSLIVLLCVALAANVCLNALCLLLSVRSELSATGEGLALFSYGRRRDALMILLASVLSNAGYRQYLIGWQLRGLWDFLRGKKGWDKFARKGFATGKK